MQRDEASRRGRPNESGGLMRVAFATTAAERVACCRRRYRRFVEEVGARVPSGTAGLDRDAFDPLATTADGLDAVGATVGAEPCGNRAFGCADLFILLEGVDMPARARIAARLSQSSGS